jgi:hypothetical protein
VVGGIQTNRAQRQPTALVQGEHRGGVEVVVWFAVRMLEVGDVARIHSRCLGGLMEKNQDEQRGGQNAGGKNEAANFDKLHAVLRLLFQFCERFAGDRNP